MIGFCYSIYFILIGQLDTSTWPRWFELPIAFDTSSILGWYLYLIGVAILDVMYTVFMVTSTTYFVCCCFYIGAMGEHFDFIVHSIQADFYDFDQKTSNPYQCKVFNDEIMGKMRKIIGIHVEIDE